ncbi:hypothetical protein CEXT_723131 [Caerostris extrusa]|uniref:Uncharacterized protein n=1 Tax=Caerostris extrusa TaxID=172846 RepID=A0AAV4X9Q7_CAEEX|nr:hypothetical protein CEXT_723131 [Caerostris extrusa]
MKAMRLGFAEVKKIVMTRNLHKSTSSRRLMVVVMSKHHLPYPSLISFRLSTIKSTSFEIRDIKNAYIRKSFEVCDSNFAFFFLARKTGG